MRDRELTREANIMADPGRETDKRLRMYSLINFSQHRLPMGWFFLFQPTISPWSLSSMHRGLSLFVGSLFCSTGLLSISLSPGLGICLGLWWRKFPRLAHLPHVYHAIHGWLYCINIYILETVCLIPQFTLLGFWLVFLYWFCI